MAVQINNGEEEREQSSADKATTETVAHSERTYAQIKGSALGFAPMRDRVIIEEDTFRTGYECVACDGTCETACVECQGTGNLISKKRVFDEETKGFKWVSEDTTQASCPTCNGTGSVVCVTCGGKGATLIVPQQSQRRPSSGIIRACGAHVMALKEGDHVMYGLHAGHVIEFRKKHVVLKILREDEILCMVHGVIQAGD